MCECLFESQERRGGVHMLVEAAKGKEREKKRKTGSVEEERKRLWMLDVDREEDFVGREEVMREIREGHDGGARRVAIVGVGGVGYVWCDVVLFPSHLLSYPNALFHAWLLAAGV